MSLAGSGFHGGNPSSDEPPRPLSNLLPRREPQLRNPPLTSRGTTSSS
jgi:hypothetical protein